MPITPIDLQTLYAQLNQIGREQAQNKQTPEIQASLQQLQQIQELKEKDDSVNQNKDIGEGLQNIKDEEKREKQKRQEKRFSSKEQGQEVKEVFNDPNLGQHIDIIG